MFPLHPHSVRASTAVPRAICTAVLLALAALACGEDIITLDGRTYTGVTDVTKQANGIDFAADGRQVQLKYRELPLGIQLRHTHNPLDSSLAAARENAEVLIRPGSAFALAELDKAKAVAIAEGKPLGFLLVWHQQFGVPARPMGSGGSNDLAHFVEAFRGCMVLVYVFHESELDKIPHAVALGLLGPEEGGWSPSMAVTNSDCTDFICEVPLGGGNHSDGPQREKVFRQKFEVVAKYLADHPFVYRPPPSPAAGSATAAAVAGASSPAPEDIVTIDGKRYEQVTDLVEKQSGLSFTCEGEQVHVPYRKLPLDVQVRHRHNALEANLAEARQSGPFIISEASAFHLKDLDKAKAKAIAEGKPLGFILIWKTFFGAPANPMGALGSRDSLAHFIEAWRDICVLVYVHHETELTQVPPAVQKGFGGPDEGGFSPSMCVTDSTVTNYICEVPCGGGESTAAAREKIFRAKMQDIAAWIGSHALVAPGAAAAKPALARGGASSTAAAVANSPASAPAPAIGAGAAAAPKPVAGGVDAEP